MPWSDRLWDEGLYLPSYIGMGDERIARVVEAVAAIQREARR
jgi:hypothetical protein